MVLSESISIHGDTPNDFLGDGEGGGGGGTGGVDDMEGAGFLDHVEILEDRAVVGHGLGADAGAAGREVLGADSGDEFLEGLGEEGFAEGAAAFVPDHGGVAAEEIPEAGEGEDFGGFAGVDVGFAVAFAGEGEDGIRTGFDAAVDEAGEVDAEEGEGWVGDGIDEVADQVADFGGEFEIFASEGDDVDVILGASKLSDPVAEESGAVEEIAGFEFTGGGFEDPAAKVVVNGEDAGVFLEGAAEAFDLADEGVADGLIINNAFLWNAEGGEAGSVGLDLAELGGVEPLEAFEAVLLAADFEVTQALDFGFGGGDNDLAADVVGDGVLAAEIGHEPDSADGKAGFQRAGLVVEAAVEDTAVVRALVAAGGVFFFKDANGCTGLADEQFTGDGETHDASADDDKVVFFQWSLTIVAGGENSLHPCLDLFLGPVGVMGSEGVILRMISRWMRSASATWGFMEFGADTELERGQRRRVRG